MTRLSLTHEIIRECICGKSNGKGNMKVGIVMAVIFFILGMVFLLIPELMGVMTLLMWFCAVLSIAMGLRSLYNAHCILEKKYVFETHECTGKGLDSSGEGVSQSPYLVFADIDRQYLHFPMLLLNTTASHYLLSMYETAEAGDIFYFLRNHDNRILYIFNERFWEMNLDEFELSGNTYVPKA